MQRGFLERIPLAIAVDGTRARRQLRSNLESMHSLIPEQDMNIEMRYIDYQFTNPASRIIPCLRVTADAHLRDLYVIISCSLRSRIRALKIDQMQSRV